MVAKIIEFLKVIFEAFSRNLKPLDEPIKAVEKPAEISVEKSKIIGEVPGWLKWFKEREGWTEFDHDKELSRGWKYTHLDYTTVIGASHAWCAMSLCSALEENGYLSSGSAAASSYANFGETCEYKLGAILPITHASGKHHVTLFYDWADKSKMLAKCIGGNQGDSINISTYNLSGNDKGHDQVMTSPRWPVKKKIVIKS